MSGYKETGMIDMIKTGKIIVEIRRRAGLTQESLGALIGVSAQAVSKWENGHNLPDIENLMLIAELTNTPYSVLLGASADPAGGAGTGDSAGTVDSAGTAGIAGTAGTGGAEDSGDSAKLAEELRIRDRLFREENMYTRMKTTASAEGLEETYSALQYMRDHHAGQFRKQGKFTAERVQYINHPLMMACHAHAMGLKDDKLLAAILLHDVVEDTGVALDELPFSEEVRRIVGLVSFAVPDGMTKEEAKAEYYERIATDPKACLVKTIDRCNNVSTMAGTFNREKLIEYIKETEQYVLPLTVVLKNQYPQYSDAAFIVKYHIISVLESIKCLMADKK